jgi:hypothetical protein
MVESLHLSSSKDNAALLNSSQVPESLLSREALVLGGGIKDGFCQRAKQAAEHPGLTSLEIVGSAAVGAGMTAMHMAGGRWGSVAKVVAGGLGVLAIEDGAKRLLPTFSAMHDSAINPEHYAQNRAIVAQNLGSACFDYPLMAAGGMLGSASVIYGSRRGFFNLERNAEAQGLAQSESSPLKLRAEADQKLDLARQKFFEISKGGLDSNDVRAAKISSADLLKYVEGKEFRSWVSAEKAAGNEVFWPTDVNKTLASGDIFTHFFKWRADNNKFSAEQLNIIEQAVRKLVPEAKSATPQDVMQLWESKEAGGNGISLNDFWHKIYWPSQKGLTAAEKLAQVNAFANTYADKVYPLVPEINKAIDGSGAHVVIVSNGDQELARAVAPVLGIKPENAVGSNLLYDKNGFSTGTNHTYEIFDGPWTARPQPGKPVSFHYWLNNNLSRFNWNHLNENKVIIAGFNGDSASADGGMMILSKPKAIGNFMVNTPGEPARIEKLYSLADKYGWTRGEFITLERSPSAFDLLNQKK